MPEDDQVRPRPRATQRGDFSLRRAHAGSRTPRSRRGAVGSPPPASAATVEVVSAGVRSAGCGWMTSDRARRGKPQRQQPVVVAHQGDRAPRQLVGERQVLCAADHVESGWSKPASQRRRAARRVSSVVVGIDQLAARLREAPPAVQRWHDRRAEQQVLAGGEGGDGIDDLRRSRPDARMSSASVMVRPLKPSSSRSTPRSDRGDRLAGRSSSRQRGDRKVAGHRQARAGGDRRAEGHQLALGQLAAGRATTASS